MLTILFLNRWCFGGRSSATTNLLEEACVLRVKSTDREAMILLHDREAMILLQDFVTDFVTK